VPDAHRCGFVTIAGRPNAGKSTLLNALVETKLAIVACKPQTTRTTVQGVVTVPGAQIVFIDTPGIHESDSLINRRMMQTVRGALDQPDLILYLADATRGFSPEDAKALATIRRAREAHPAGAAFLILNKVDLVRDKRELLPLIEKFQAELAFDEYIPISALKKDGVAKLLDTIAARLPEGPPMFPEDYLTDQPERFRAAELVREKILRLTRQEVPHAVGVAIEKWEETPRLTRITATVIVERNGQKAIIIGERGAMLREIGTQARREMEELFEKRVFLELFVKVIPNWRENPSLLNELDWRSMTGSESESGNLES